MLRPFLLVLLCVALISSVVAAQNVCPSGTANDRLICLIPRIYGVNGLDVRAPGQTGDFGVNFLSSSLSSLESSVARQSSLLPSASPSSGATFSWDAATQTFVESTASLGPILAERADTIGKYRLSVAFDYQYFNFNNIDGVDLKKLTVVLPQNDFHLQSDPTRTCSLNGDNRDDCAFIRDVIRTHNRVDLKIHQFTTFVTFGLTSRIDVSAAIPIENIRAAMSSDVTIIHNDIPGRYDHAFAPTDSCTSPCLTNSFSSVGTASGIGDITLRVKGTAWKGERATFALGVDVRLPTGDSLNYLGSGTAGVKPFAIWSYRSRVSPHAFVGYETNGKSIIAGDLSSGSKEKLPSDLSYSGGVDVWLTKRLTAAFDVVGQQVFQAPRTANTTMTEPGKCLDIACLTSEPTIEDPTLSAKTGSYNVSNASVGVKIKPFGRLLLVGNVLVRLNDSGLRSRFVPLIGLSYSFSPSK